MNKLFNIRNYNRSDAYVMLWFLYISQGSFYASGGIVGKIVLFAIMLWSLKDFLHYLPQYLGPYFKGYKILVCYVLLLGIILLISGRRYQYDSGDPLVNWYYLKYVFMNWFPIVTFYRLFETNSISLKRLRIYSFVFLIMALISYIGYQRYMFSVLLLRAGETAEITNNVGYQFVALFPFLYILKEKKLLQYAYFMFIMFFVISGMKRGAIVIGGILTIAFIYNEIKYTKGTKKFIAVALIAICLVAGLYFVMDFLSNSEYAQARLLATQEGNMSGRDDIYNSAWNYFLNEADTLYQLIGGGAYYSIKLFGIETHNDWLEHAVCGGILGLLIYLIYWRSFYHQAKNASHDYKLIISTCLFITIVQTFFSMSAMTTGMSAILAYAIFSENHKKCDV